MRVILLVLAMAVAALAPTGAFAAGALGTKRVSAALDFAILIPPFIRARLGAPPAQLVLGAEDRDRGSIEQSTALDITCNGPHGLDLSVAFDARLVARVEIVVAGRRFEVSDPSGSVRIEMGRLGHTRLPVTYRIYLARGLPEGQYRWPVAIQVAGNDP